MFFDKQGKPLELFEWAELLQDNSYRMIERTDLPDGHSVSTIWLGMDHSFIPYGMPQLFETSIFLNGKLVKVLGRCATLDQAKEMHELAVAEYGG